ncbi:YhcN/YlaJ family sporulation lipoprotein [Bacillus ectoiniformans]|uniref:YhcN/YlaJ family sporulation lipoprotein n=1 Tax=Bacillus ectoiniformans TaxID=1494429 RepID=UPI00195D85D5|nr:YhcN/YlaJ family sporulation lipoprotein [Bacillus ectoiniformans]MBM7647381.1 YhcN/YlaJ family sporulation lipoprotein [Bacillus ectoiniformans]
MRKLSLGFTFLLAIPLFAACAGNEEGRNDTNQGMETRDVRYNNVGYDVRDVNDGNMDMDQNDVTRNETRMEVADDAAKEVVDLKEVKEANVIVTENNAYVSADLTDNYEGEMTKEIEKKISRAVKSADNDIDNVYVSTDPDFMNRMTGYGDRIQRGEPVDGFYDEFTETTRRVFPNAR